MLTVHHLGVSQSDRVVWLCEELEIPYDLVRYDRDPVTRLAPAAYKALHPYGTAPVIEDDGVVLGESGAILEYIAQTHGGGRLMVKPAEPGYADYLYWFHFANASMMTGGMMDMVIGLMSGGVETDTTRALRSRGDRAHALVEARLGEAPYFAGADFTLADNIMLFPLSTMRVFAPRDLTPYPNIRAYLARIAERPAYRRAAEKADPGFQAPMS